MYQIIGVERSGRQVVVATPTGPGDALTHYRAAQNLPFARIIALSPDGDEIDGNELSRRFKQGEDRRFV